VFVTSIVVAPVVDLDLRAKPRDPESIHPLGFR
jgi:hypothetical protein